MRPLTYSETNSADPSKVARGDLTSASDLDGGVSQGAGATYSQTGVDLAGTDYFLWTPSGAEETALDAEAHIHFEVENDWLTYAPLTVGVLLGLDNASSARFYVNSLATQFARDQLSAVNKSLADQLNIVNRPTETLSHTVVDILFTSSSQKTYVDNVLMKDELTGPSANAMGNIFLGNNNAGSENWDRASDLKNFYLYSEHQVAQTTSVTLQMFGDSISAQANYTSGFPQYTAPDSIGRAANADLSAACTIERRLRMAGYDASIRNAAIAGANASSDAAKDLGQQIAGVSDLTGAIVTILIGTNDALSGTLRATYKTDYQAAIDACVAKGASLSNMVLLTVPTTSNDPAQTGNNASVAEANSIIYELQAENLGISVADFFTAMGGTNVITEYWQSGDYHPSDIGSNVYGNTVADVLISSVLASSGGGGATQGRGITRGFGGCNK